jgi:hypothetical protein
LPQVPACTKCNKEKSDLEHYLTSLLPFGGRHKQAEENLSTMVPKRLVKNRKLHSRLARNRGYALSEEPDGSKVSCMVLAIDGQRLLDLFKFITKGLLWFHWGALLKENHSVKTISLTEYGEEFFQKHFFSLNSINSIKSEISNNTFSYKGSQAVDTPEISAWQYTIYNGVKFTETVEDFAESSTKIGALTGPNELIDKFQA